MATLSASIAIAKRDELIKLGYTVIPNVLTDPLLGQLRRWSEDIFQRLPVDPKFRYQGSDIHVYAERTWQSMDQQPNERIFPDPIVKRLIDYSPQRQVCQQLQLEGLQAHDNIILLSKPAYGPPLYWHQDYMNWNSPAAATPWPTVIFLSYYLSDTTRENGCLRVLPGSHRRRDRLHNILPDAHGPEIQAIDNPDHPVFMDRNDAVDLPLMAGDLVTGDARLLHGA